LAGVFDAESLEVILNSLEVADLSILVVKVNHGIGSILDFTDLNGPEVFMDLLLESPNGVESWLHPVAEAVVGDNVIVLGVPSLDESGVHGFGEESMSLHVVELYGIACRAVWTLFEHTHEWRHLFHFLHHVAAINGPEGEKCEVFVHF
jgi:hypothetical protein